MVLLMRVGGAPGLSSMAWSQGHEGGVFLLVFVQRCLSNPCTGGGRCRFVVVVVFVKPLFPFVRGIVGAGIVLWLRPGREVLWGVDRKQSTLLPS